MQKFGINKYALIIIPALFLFFSAPVALRYVFHYPDEKYYTDAVLQMMEKGDYLTPYQADGTPRFLKPIVTYWVLIASYTVFGVSEFSSRLLFWLAGAILVLITFFMAKSLTGNKKTAIICALITAANPLTVFSAARSIPDILLALFLTVSAWGFMEIMIREKPEKRFFWMAYLGAALAFETKGLPAALFMGVNILFLLFNPWKKVKIITLLKPVPIIVSMVVAVGWFLLMFRGHGASYFNSFYDDQVGERVSINFVSILKNTLLAIVTLLLFFFPWSIAGINGIKNIRARFGKSSYETKAIIGFSLVWALVVVLTSGLVFKFYDRYVLPAIPVLSLYFALLLSQKPWLSSRYFIRFFTGLNIFVLAIMLFFVVFVSFDWFYFAALLLGLAFFGIYFSGRTSLFANESLLAGSILWLVFNGVLLMYPTSLPGPGTQLANNLAKLGADKNTPVFVYGNIKAASRIRIASHAGLNVVSKSTDFTLPSGGRHFLVFKVKEQGQLDLNGYQVFPGSEEWSNLKTQDFPGFLQEKVQKLKDKGQKYLIAVPAGNK